MKNRRKQWQELQVLYRYFKFQTHIQKKFIVSEILLWAQLGATSQEWLPYQALLASIYTSSSLFITFFFSREPNRKWPEKIN